MRLVVRRDNAYPIPPPGEVPKWPYRHRLEIGWGLYRPTWVRIPPSPPINHLQDILVSHSGNRLGEWCAPGTVVKRTVPSCWRQFKTDHPWRLPHHPMFYKRGYPYFNSAVAQRVRSRRLFRSVMRDHVDIAEVKEIGRKPGARWGLSGHLGARIGDELNQAGLDPIESDTFLFESQGRCQAVVAQVVIEFGFLGC